MAIVYAEPRYSIRNLALSGLGDILGKVAENWMQKSKMSRLMEGNKTFFDLINKRNKELTAYPEFNEPDFSSPVATPSASNPLERVAEKAGVTGMANAAFPGLQPKKTVGSFVQRDVDPLELIAYAYNNGGKQLGNMPSLTMQDVMFLTDALDKSRQAPYYNATGARKIQGMDELHEGMSSNPLTAPFAGSAYVDERAGASGLDALIGKARNDNDAARNVTYAKQVENDLAVGKERNEIERQKIPLMRQENNLKLRELQLRLQANPTDLRAKQAYDFFKRQDDLLAKGPDNWTIDEARWMMTHDDKFDTRQNQAGIAPDYKDYVRWLGGNPTWLNDGAPPPPQGTGDKVSSWLSDMGGTR